jgi:hypothetical protein
VIPASPFRPFVRNGDQDPIGDLEKIAGEYLNLGNVFQNLKALREVVAAIGLERQKIGLDSPDIL